MHWQDVPLAIVELLFMVMQITEPRLSIPTLAAELQRKGMAEETWPGRLIGLQMPIQFSPLANTAFDAFLQQQLLPYISSCSDNNALVVMLSMYGSVKVRLALVEAKPSIQESQVWTSSHSPHHRYKFNSRIA